MNALDLARVLAGQDSSGVGFFKYFAKKSLVADGPRAGAVGVRRAIDYRQTVNLMPSVPSNPTNPTPISTGQVLDLLGEVGSR